ncbi:hypothetical protein BX616_003587 [Lobosporangium transversale]|nr:hypothetical protein BX616_003587 [Lobosporangium transversale]
MSIDFTGPNPSILGFSSSGANAKLIPIPGVNYLVKEVANHFTLIDDGVELVKMESPSAPAEVKGNVVKTAVENTALKIIPGQEDGFSKFIEAVLSRPTYTLTINGNVDVKGQIPGTSAASSKLLTLTNIGVSSSFTLRCMGSSVQIEHVKLVSLTEDADSGAVTLVHDINIHNPSQLNLKLGDSAFHLLNADGVLVGVANIPNFNLAMGDNVMTSTVKFTDSDTYNALTTTSNTFTVVGFDGSTKNPILTKAMGAFKSQITIPKLEAA